MKDLEEVLVMAVKEPIGCGIAIFRVAIVAAIGIAVSAELWRFAAWAFTP